MKKKAIISVYNKEGIVEFAKELEKLDFEILSTGGTSDLLKKNNLKVTNISDYTGSKELFEGRLKALHPKIFGGILADKTNKEHLNQLKENNIEPIDLVVVNLYPFEETVKKNAKFEEAIEMIDVGGPSMLRAAAKNFKNVVVIVDPKDYGLIIKELKTKKAVDIALREELARKVFERTARYDSIINNYLNDRNNVQFPEVINLTLKKIQDLRYGENPHQKASFYEDADVCETCIPTAKQLHGKELSFNNILDLNDAFELVKDFKGPTAAIIKHTNPCGVASDAEIESALKKAYEVDSLSAFGSVIALNRNCNLECAEIINLFFVEVVICPKFEPKALDLLKSKKNLRLLESCEIKKRSKGYDMKKVVGGVLVQTRAFPEITEKGLKVVSKRKPTKEEIKDMLYALKVNKHVKSNSIVFAKNNVAVGIGAGQMSRVVSVKLAADKAKERAKGSAMSSDAFFPFRDGIDEAAKSGVTSVIQPGGSIRDEEVIKAADEHNMAMVFTGVRLFKH